MVPSASTTTPTDLSNATRAAKLVEVDGHRLGGSFGLTGMTFMKEHARLYYLARYFTDQNII
jgi:hypothetical protein